MNQAGELAARMPCHRRQRLREATGAQHRDLEATLERTGSFASIEGYRRYLAAILPVYAETEAAIEAAGPARLMPDWPARRKLGLILADLGAGAELVPPPSPAPAWGAGDILGALYVTEGATLGGALLSRTMHDAGVMAKGRCFLDPYGRQRGTMWRGYLARLEAAALVPAEEDAACRRAADRFAAFAAALAPLASPKPAAWRNLENPGFPLRYTV